MRRLLLLIVFILVLLGAAIAYMPLGFVLDRSGAGAAGIGWAKVDGTITKGRISGLYISTQPLGDVTLKLRPLSLLSLSPSYDVQWGGAAGRGTGILTFTRTTLIGEEIRMQQEIGALESLSPPVRAMGGQLRVADGSFRLSKTGCEQASGTLSTDALSTLAAQYGRQFGQISGPIDCETGSFLIDMEGRSDAGDEVAIEAKAALTGQGEFVTRIRTQDTQIIIALTQIGFVRENGEFVYRQSRSAGIQ